jgi:glycerophosphoryl diester phosphodiesterase
MTKMALALLAGCLAFFGAGDTGKNTPLKPPRHGGMYVVAHRGAHEGIPENTLAAYRKAIELGVDFVEVDARTTKDGKIVSVHNRTLEDYTQGAFKDAVRNYTLAELKSMDIGSRVGPEWKDARIPTLEEVLDACKGKVGIYLDFKDADVTQTLSMLRARDIQRETLWYADDRNLKQVREQCPECILMPDPGPEKALPHVLEKWKPSVVASSWKFYSEAFAKACHDAGAIVIVDEGGPKSWEPALQWKTDGLQTNKPAALIQMLDGLKEKK